MSHESTDESTHHHHSLHERIDAAKAAAEEVVADDAGGQIGGEVSGAFVPLEEAAAALRAALHPDRLAERGGGVDGPGDAPAAEDPPAAS